MDNSADGMFPNDRFSSLLPETDRLHEELHQTVHGNGFVPKTAREFDADGAHKMVLHQFFPSWDVQAYVRMAKLHLHVHNSKYPQYESTGELPQLSDGNFLVPKHEILQHLQTFHSDLDDWLDDVQKSESFAFRAMVHEKLLRVMAYCRWVDPTTYKEITRPQLKKHVPFPLNHILPKKMHLDCINKLKLSGVHTKEHAYVTARDCYTALNAKLASSSSLGGYFFGDRASALDAAVFGHTVDALSDPQLCKAVYQYAPLLVTHAEKIRDTYFALESEGNRPRALSIEQLQASYYSQNHDNYFAAMDTSFMNKVPPSLQVTFLEPYRSLNWSRRELVAEVAKTKAEKQQQQSAGVDEHGLPIAAQGFDKSTRNVIIGAVAAIVLYALANLPVQINFSDLVGDENDDEELDDDDEFYYEDDDDE